MPAFEVILRRPNRPDRVRYHDRADAQVGDILTIDGGLWVIIAKEAPFEFRSIARVICVPRTVRTLH